MQSELQNSKYHGGGLVQGKSRSRATSREDLLYGSDNRSQYALSTRSAGPYGGGSRQQQNGRGGRDENGFKARIHVISPDRDAIQCCHVISYIYGRDFTMIVSNSLWSL